MAKETAINALKPGTLLKSKAGTYEIVKVLGAGSFGITYLATSQVMHGNIPIMMRFAIKEHFLSASCYRGDDGASVNTVPSAKTDVKNSLADFITEAQRLQELCLKSRSIVKVNETFQANGTAYYVMQYLEGGNPGKCSEEEAVSLVMQVADALRVIHEERLLHLDVKPDNIVMTTNIQKETYPVLIDFGIAKHFDSKGHPTSSLSAKGASPGFAPQEQYAGVDVFSPKFDIYALGAVLFYLVTGKNPPDAFKISPNQQELKQELAGKVSANVEKAILNAMKPAASERTATIRQFCDDLMGIDFVPVLDAGVSELDFSKEKGKANFTVNSNIGWTVFADEDWCKVVKKGNAVEVSVPKNKLSQSRRCRVILNGSPYQLARSIEVSQEGAGTVVFEKKKKKEKKKAEKKELAEWWSRNGKRVYQGAGIGVGAGCIVALCLLIPWGSKEEPQSEPEVTEIVAETAPDSVPEPVAQNEENDLAEELVNEETKALVEEAPKPVEEKPASEQPAAETNDEKFARAAKDFNLMLSLAKDNYSKAYYPVAKMYFDRGDKTNAEKWAKKAVAANVNRSAAQSIIDRINPAAETAPAEASLDQQFKNAKTIADFKALADKGYAKAYAPLAEKYLVARNYESADRYAKKALSTPTGRASAIKTIENLDNIGYYDDPKTGGKPKY